MIKKKVVRANYYNVCNVDDRTKLCFEINVVLCCINKSTSTIIKLVYCVHSKSTR